MLVDAVGNLFGGLPIFKDAYAKIFEGYDVDNYAYSAVNDLLDSALNLFEVAGNILTNEGSVQDRNRAVRNLAYSVGQMFGIPVRNVYNVFFGLTKRFNPEAAYMIDSALYEKNYQNELYKAIEQDDAEMTSFIMSLLLGERMNENVDEAVFNELLILSKNGQKVIPRSVPSSITIDEVEYPLSAAEQAAIKDIYATSEKSLKALFAKSKYNTLSDEQKAAAIDFIYDTYYDKALEGALGIDRGNNSLIIADVVGVDNLALLYVTTKGLTSDIDRRGNVISGSKRKKVVAAINSLGVSTEKKLLLICAKGYSLQDNDIRGLSAEKAKKYLLRYILSLKGKTKAEKAEIAELCGFEVVNGMIDGYNNMRNSYEKYEHTEDDRNRLVGAVMVQNTALLEILTTVYVNSKNLPQGVKDLINLKYANCQKALGDDEMLRAIVEAVREKVGTKMDAQEETGSTEV